MATTEYHGIAYFPDFSYQFTHHVNWCGTDSTLYTYLKDLGITRDTREEAAELASRMLTILTD